MSTQIDVVSKFYHSAVLAATQVGPIRWVAPVPLSPQEGQGFPLSIYFWGVAGGGPVHTHAHTLACTP